MKLLVLSILFLVIAYVFCENIDRNSKCLFKDIFFLLFFFSFHSCKYLDFVVEQITEHSIAKRAFSAPKGVSGFSRAKGLSRFPFKSVGKKFGVDARKKNSNNRRLPENPRKRLKALTPNRKNSRNDRRRFRGRI